MAARSFIFYLALTFFAASAGVAKDKETDGTTSISKPKSSQSSVRVLKREECVEYDVTKKMGAVRRQGVSEWCWAMVAADLIGYQQGITPREQVSAIDVAATTESTSNTELDRLALRLPKRFLDQNLMQTVFSHKRHADVSALTESGGLVANGVLAYQRNLGWCSETQLPSIDENNKDYFIQHILKNKLGDDSKTFSESEAIDYLIGLPIEKCLSPSFVTGSKGVVTSRQLQRALNEHASQKVKSTIDEKFCSSRKPLKPMVPFTIDVNGDNPEWKRARVQLVAKAGATLKGPFGIAIRPDFLTMGREEGNGDGLHGVSVVAARWSEHGCQFKIRNSYGPDCSTYHPTFKKGCDQGHVWLSEEDIANRMTDVFGIHP